MNVTPCSRLSCSMMSRSLSAVSESTLAVGSSARTTAGLAAMARAMATRCCWPPESSEGRRSSIPSSPTSAKQLADTLSPFLVVQALHPHDDLGVFVGGEHRHEVIGLEYESDPVASDLAELLSAESAQVFPLENHATRSRFIESTDEVQQSRLSRAGGAADGGEFPFLDGKGKSSQGGYVQLALLVVLLHIFHVDNEMVIVHRWYLELHELDCFHGLHVTCFPSRIHAR